MHRQLLAGMVFIVAACIAVDSHAQATFKQLPISNEAWIKPFPPVRIVGNLYYVGTYDLAVYLITTNEGHILINTGVNDSTGPIRKNIEALGFKLEDVKLLLATHGHWDHVGAMAEIKRISGARMLMHEADADLVESGGGVDYRYPQGRGPIFEPVKVDQRLKEGDTVKLGGMALEVIHHPGHTKGSTSFSFKVNDAGRSYDVLIVNMGSINPGVNVDAMPGFAGITEAYASTFAKQSKLTPQIWVSSHAGQFDLHKKYAPGDAYDPNRFVDPGGYQLKVQFYEKLFRARLAKDRERTQ